MFGKKSQKYNYADRVRKILQYNLLVILEFFLVLIFFYVYLNQMKTLTFRIFLVIAFVQSFIAVVLGIFFFFDKKQYQQFINEDIYQVFINHAEELPEEFVVRIVERLDELKGKKSIIQFSTKQAEFLALQNQINPHFLYNTLEAIRGDALCLGVDKIADITEALSVFFRYTITNTRNLVTLQEELDNVENYYIIQKYRFEDKIDLRIVFRDDEQQLLQMKMPKLSLQPIVENAIFHGIEKISAGGMVEIEVEIVDWTFHINVKDNGKGMNPDVLKKLNENLHNASCDYSIEEGNKKGGIALRNVCRRIKILFGEEYGLHVSSILGIGTNVEIILPLNNGLES